MHKLTFFLILFLQVMSTAFSQPYKKAGLPIEERINDLLSRMTPEEKFRQLFMIPGDITGDSSNYYSGIFGLQINVNWEANDITGQKPGLGEENPAYESAEKINRIQKYFLTKSRLGIPIIPFDEALHGYIRKGSTMFPQSIGLTATWDLRMMKNVAGAIADECVSRGIRMVLSPVVNVATDVRWGRTEETYGEDPFLISEMAVAYVSEFEKRGVITTPKHFAANVGDGGRDSYPIHWNERYMREIIFPPFEACVKRGSSGSVMAAYNSYDGSPCSANDFLLNELVKKEWGFKGIVISDAGGIGGANVLHYTAPGYAAATVKSISSGLDVIFQTELSHESLFSPPFLDGSIDGKTIDSAVARVLRIKFRLGLFDNPYMYPQRAKEVNGSEAHKNLALQSALESMVLLKNEGNVLPFSKEISSITVLGQDAAEARFGGYSGPGNEKVSILQGIKNVAEKNITVNYSYGCSRIDTAFVVVPSSSFSCIMNGEKCSGLKGEYFNNVDFSGDPVIVRCDPEINFQWTLFSPDQDKLGSDFYSVRWTGKLTAIETGNYKIGIDGNDGYRLFIDGKLAIDNRLKCSRKTTMKSWSFEKGKEYDIRIEYSEPNGNAWFRLVWNMGIVNKQDEEITKAVKLAAGSDIAIIVAGIEEGEFRDRAYLNLPGRQEELIKKVAAAGKTVIVVLVGGSAITMSNWIDDAKGILMAWYPGEQGGNAVADALFGKYNPAGRLPITFPVSEGQLPLVYNHKPTGRGDDYLDLTGQPLFPFGYGLSYTDFRYSGIRLGSAEIGPKDSTVVSVTVTNTGKIEGDEIVQLYIRDELASVAQPVTELKGFVRIHLDSGENREIRFNITPEMLSMLDKDLKEVVEPGEFKIRIGASSKDIRQQVKLKVR